MRTSFTKQLLFLIIHSFAVSAVCADWRQEWLDAQRRNMDNPEMNHPGLPVLKNELLNLKRERTVAVAEYQSAIQDHFPGTIVAERAAQIRFVDAKIALNLEAQARIERPTPAQDESPDNDDSSTDDDPAAERTPASERKEPTLTAGAKAILKAMYETAPNATYEEIDCTRFMAKTLRNAGFRLDRTASTRLYMSDVPPSQLERLVAANDPRITGVVGALVSSGQATPVNTGTRVQEGDVIQYFYRQGGEYKGHAGIIEKVYDDGSRVDVYGSHESKGGVGTFRKLNLRGKKYYLARPN